MYIRQTAEIIKEFNSKIKELISKLEKKSRDIVEIANLDRLRKRIQLLRSTLGSAEIIRQSAPYFKKYSDDVISRNEEFFMKMDVRAEFLKDGKPIEKQDEFIFTLADSIKVQYKNATQGEKDGLYLDVKSLHDCCLEYEISIS